MSVQAKNQVKVGNHLERLSPLQLVKDEKIAKKFMQLYGAIHGKKADAFYQAEQFNFIKVLQENVALQKCDKLSLYGAFLDVAVNGLSFDPTKKLVYLVPYGNKAKLQISPYGELLIRQQTGQIKHADNPVLVYENDDFEVTTDGNGTTVTHKKNFKETGGEIIACFLRIVRNDDTVDFKVLTAEELEQIRSFSKSPNSAAWTKGYAGMFMAKTIKHAFKTYAKVRIGQFSQLETDVEEAEEISYDLEEGADAGFVDEHAEMEANEVEVEEVVEEPAETF